MKNSAIVIITLGFVLLYVAFASVGAGSQLVIRDDSLQISDFIQSLGAGRRLPTFSFRLSLEE